MTSYICDRWGAMEREPRVERLRELLQSLDIEDNEHPDIARTHETGWSLSAFASGRLVWENVEAGDSNARHMTCVPRDKVLDLWLKLAQSEVVVVEAYG